MGIITRRRVSSTQKPIKMECSATIVKGFWPLTQWTGRKLNEHKTFRRRPGRLLNVLCSFNLRPVSTGDCCCKALYLRCLWESWIRF